MKSRISSHVIETKARNYIRSVVDNYYENGDALFRELSERDYGIDGLIELFCDGEPTGQIALVQIKGTSNTIVPLKTKNVVTCLISSSNAKYAQQNNIPILLLYADINKHNFFYYVDVNDAIKNIDNSKITEQGSITIHIPIENNSEKDLDSLFGKIRDFYR